MAQILRATKGATFTEPLTITDRDGTTTDLLGAEIRWMAKARIDDIDAAAILTATKAGGTIVVLDATAGSIRFDIPAATMDVLEPGRVLLWTLEVYVGGVVVRYPDGFQGGPGKLLVEASAIGDQPT